MSSNQNKDPDASGRGAKSSGNTVNPFATPAHIQQIRNRLQTERSANLREASSTGSRSRSSVSSDEESKSSPRMESSVSIASDEESESSPRMESSLSNASDEESESSPRMESSLSSASDEESESSPRMESSASSAPEEESESSPRMESSVSIASDEESESSPRMESSASSAPEEESESSPRMESSLSSAPDEEIESSPRIESSAPDEESESSPRIESSASSAPEEENASPATEAPKTRAKTPEGFKKININIRDLLEQQKLLNFLSGPPRPDFKNVQIPAAALVPMSPPPSPKPTLVKRCTNPVSDFTSSSTSSSRASREPTPGCSKSMYQPRSTPAHERQNENVAAAKNQKSSGIFQKVEYAHMTEPVKLKKLSTAEKIDVIMARGKPQPPTKCKSSAGEVFCHACVTGNVDTVVNVLYEGDVNVNDTLNTKQSWTGLQFACYNSQVNVVKVLIKLGADPSFKDNRENIDALMSATSSPQDEDEGLLTCVEQLMRHVRLNVNSVQTNGASPLIMAVRRSHEKIVKLLLDNGANVNHFDLDKRTAINWATYRNNITMVRLLLMYQANPVLKNKNGETAYYVAINNGYSEIAEILKFSQTSSWTPGLPKELLNTSERNWEKLQKYIHGAHAQDDSSSDDMSIATEQSSEMQEDPILKDVLNELGLQKWSGEMAKLRIDYSQFLKLNGRDLIELGMISVADTEKVLEYIQNAKRTSRDEAKDEGDGLDDSDGNALDGKPLDGKASSNFMMTVLEYLIKKYRSTRVYKLWKRIEESDRPSKSEAGLVVALGVIGVLLIKR